MAWVRREDPLAPTAGLLAAMRAEVDALEAEGAPVAELDASLRELEVLPARLRRQPRDRPG